MRDLTGLRFGDLLAICSVGRAREQGRSLGYIWRFRCLCDGSCGAEHEGGTCNQTRMMLTMELSRLSRHLACRDCAARNRSRRTPSPVEQKAKRVTAANYKRLRERFSPAEWRSYHEHLGNRTTTGREGLQNQVEAVELALIFADKE